MNSSVWGSPIALQRSDPGSRASGTDHTADMISAMSGESVRIRSAHRPGQSRHSGSSGLTPVVRIASKRGIPHPTRKSPRVPVNRPVSIAQRARAIPTPRTVESPKGAIVGTGATATVLDATGSAAGRAGFVEVGDAADPWASIRRS